MKGGSGRWEGPGELEQAAVDWNVQTFINAYSTNHESSCAVIIFAQLSMMKTFHICFFLDTVCVPSFTLCMMVITIEFYTFVPVLVMLNWLWDHRKVKSQLNYFKCFFNWVQRNWVQTLYGYYMYRQGHWNCFSWDSICLRELIYALADLPETNTGHFVRNI